MNPRANPRRSVTRSWTWVLASAPDATGDRVIAASFDPYNVQLWNTGAGVDTFQYPLQLAQVVSVAVSAENGRIVSGSTDGTVRIWPNPPAMPADRALCQKLTTNLSEQDWRTWISPDIAYEPYKQICPELPPGQ